MKYCVDFDIIVRGLLNCKMMFPTSTSELYLTKIVTYTYLNVCFTNLKVVIQEEIFSGILGQPEKKCVTNSGVCNMFNVNSKLQITALLCLGIYCACLVSSNTV